MDIGKLYQGQKVVVRLEAFPEKSFEGRISEIGKLSYNKEFVNITRKYLSGGKILEGGCGNGNVVISLNHAGFQTTGIDYAENTISKLKLAYPYTDFQHGDLQDLNFPGRHFDGYWSIGVIEHYENYDKIIKEAYRVLKDGGYLFLIFPHMSLLRRLKKWLGMYQTEQGEFFEYLLDKKQVLNRLGAFKHVGTHYRAGAYGVMKEVKCLKGLMHYLARGNLLKKIINGVMLIVSSRLCGHSILIVLKK